MASITSRAMRYFLRAVDKIFFPASDDEVQAEAVRKFADNSGGERRDGPDRSIERKNTGYQDRWIDGLEGSVDDNEKRSIENRVMLERIDFRTVWLMRIVVGVGVALLTRALVIDLGLMPGFVIV